jgi:hypothetical protein
MFSRFFRLNANGDFEIKLGCRSTVFVYRFYADEAIACHALVGLRSKTSLGWVVCYFRVAGLRELGPKKRVVTSGQGMHRCRRTVARKVILEMLFQDLQISRRLQKMTIAANTIIEALEGYSISKSRDQG